MSRVSSGVDDMLKHQRLKKPPNLSCCVTKYDRDGEMKDEDLRPVRSWMTRDDNDAKGVSGPTFYLLMIQF